MGIRYCDSIKIERVSISTVSGEPTESLVTIHSEVPGYVAFTQSSTLQGSVGYQPLISALLYVEDSTDLQTNDEVTVISLDNRKFNVSAVTRFRDLQIEATITERETGP